ncbi:MAG: class I SAM-dependent DNA methyltransferase [Sandaracinaceae bacterium]
MTSVGMVSIEAGGDTEKRANNPSYYSDAGAFFVPPEARWPHLRDEVHHNVGDGMNKALAALEETNTSLEGVLAHIDFNRKVGQSKIPDKRLRDLIKHFSEHRLRNEDFEYPDLLGAAYEYLIRDFADSAGKKGGEFYTPRSVVRMMVRIAEPKEGMKIYDPCSGSGGMLVLSKEYLDEHRLNSRNLGLYGQESNGSVWSISKMNMLLHGIPDADMRNGDTLAEPLHADGGELMRFDRVLTNPPFSQNYTKDAIPFPERFRFGFCPEGGKKADLMFVQHMVSVLRPGGMCLTVMPHGVLFRGGAERDIRTGLLDEDLLDAVIGLGANLFYGTGIPACLLVLRAPGAKPKERKGKVLFINADREYYEGRAQNYLYPEHIEKIVSAWRAFDDIDGFARVVTREELRDNDDNLNIRRYADNAPPPEPHDVRAHLFGGIPKAEVEERRRLFHAHGLDPRRLLTEKDERCLDFVDGLDDKADLKKRIEADEGVTAKEQALTHAVEAWWTANRDGIAALPNSNQLMTLREQLLSSFEESLRPVGLLNRFQVSGVIATWWGDVQNDLKTIAARGFLGLIEAWEVSILTAMEDKKSKENAFDHRLVRLLLPEYLADISELEAKKAELDAAIKDAKASEDDEDAEVEEQLSEAGVKALKMELSAVKKKLKTKEGTFTKRLEEARVALGEDAATDLTLDVLRADLDAILGRYVADHRQQLVAAFEGWWDKYRVTLTSIEGERDAAAGKLRGFLGSLGYA